MAVTEIKRLNVKVESKLYDEFQKVVKEQGNQVSYEIRSFMKNYISEYKHTQKVLKEDPHATTWDW